MSVTFSPKIISAGTFRDIRRTLTAGIGFFQDGVYRYAVADRDIFRADVVRRVSSSMTFTATMVALPIPFRVVINGNYFAGKALYARAMAGVVDPADVNSIGDVRQSGATTLPDTGGAKNFFYFGRDNATPANYDGGLGNPPASIFEGMGGLGPVILPNTVTRVALKYGDSMIYASDPARRTLPANAADMRDCVQRSNATYSSLNREAKDGTGFCIVATSDVEGIVLLLIKPDGENGAIDDIRDKLFDASFNVACFTDGASSACMAVDREVVFAPNRFKDDLIEVGIGLFNFQLVDVTLTVRFVSIRVINDKSIFGAGEWTVSAAVNGSLTGSFAGKAVKDGDVVMLGWVATVALHPSGGDGLVLTMTGRDTAGLDEDLGAIKLEFSPFTSPAWGVGGHLVKSSVGAYEATIEIAK